MPVTQLQTRPPIVTADPAGAPDAVITRARAAQTAWARTTVRHRLAILRRLRHAIAAHSADFAGDLGNPDRTLAQSYAAEIVPLADAIRFLERDAPRILRPGRLGRRGRPAWLSRTTLEIRREPFGVALVIAPGNYPLFLPGVHALQALAAGNAVVVKPAPGGSPPIRRLRALAINCGLHPDLFTVVDEDPSVVTGLLDAGVDKVFLTGSADTGRRVLSQLAERLIPAVMELSGCDAVFVRPEADLDLVARSLAFALALNGGRTCIAPRRVFVPRNRLDALCDHLAPLIKNMDAVVPERPLFDKARRLIAGAVAQGAQIVAGGIEAFNFRPTVLRDVRAEMNIAQADLFVPVLSLIPVDDDDHALRQNARCPYALGAAIFGDDPAARELAGRVSAGVVVINDLIVPHADPRLPFGGRGEGGFGVTRGAEGLLEMTRPKAIATRRGRARPHLDPPQPGDEFLFANYLTAVHGVTLWQRIAAAGRVAKALMRRNAANPPKRAAADQQP